MKGQTMIDALLLMFALSLLVASLVVFLGNDSVKMQGLRYETTKHQSGLVSILSKFIEAKNPQGQTAIRGRVIDLLAYRTCHGCPTNNKYNFCADLEDQLNKSLTSINKGERHYILVATDAAKVYDKQESVCLDSIPLARFEMETSCGKKMEVIYGTWFNWMDPPEKCS